MLTPFHTKTPHSSLVSLPARDPHLAHLHTHCGTTTIALSMPGSVASCVELPGDVQATRRSILQRLHVRIDIEFIRAKGSRVLSKRVRKGTTSSSEMSVDLETGPSDPKRHRTQDEVRQDQQSFLFLAKPPVDQELAFEILEERRFPSLSPTLHPSLPKELSGFSAQSDVDLNLGSDQHDHLNDQEINNQSINNQDDMDDQDFSVDNVGNRDPTVELKGGTVEPNTDGTVESKASKLLEISSEALGMLKSLGWRRRRHGRGPWHPGPHHRHPLHYHSWNPMLDGIEALAPSIQGATRT